MTLNQRVCHSELIMIMEQNHDVKSRGEGSGGDIVFRPSPFDSLPEECISIIVSFTSPRDACITACVSKTCKSAVKSDIVWEKFLPPDYSSQSRDFSSRKELYFALCDNPVLIEDGKMSLWLDKALGKKCIMLSAVNIIKNYGKNTQHWQSIQRFDRLIELPNSWFLVIHGRINTSLLSRRTRYSAYIVFKKTSRFYPFKDEAIRAEVRVVGHKASRRFICFDAFPDEHFLWREKNKVEVEKPKEREDGWMEIELGEFFNEGGFEEIDMSASDIRQISKMEGLIIHGIEIRPTKIN